MTTSCFSVEGMLMYRCILKRFSWGNVDTVWLMRLLLIPISVCSGLISDKGTIEEAVTSIKRNGVGLKGKSCESGTSNFGMWAFFSYCEGVLRTKIDEVDQHSLNVFLRFVSLLVLYAHTPPTPSPSPFPKERKRIPVHWFYWKIIYGICMHKQYVLGPFSPPLEWPGTEAVCVCDHPWP